MIRKTQVTVLPMGEPLDSKEAKTIEVIKENGKELLAVSDYNDCLLIKPADWAELRHAIDMMMDQINYAGGRENTVPATNLSQRS